jgi:hypothetical protein
MPRSEVFWFFVGGFAAIAITLGAMALSVVLS